MRVFFQIFRGVKSQIVFVFFFSSRRRHTRFDCDWSSDVCSSDLIDGRAGRSYVIEYVESLTSTNWRELAYVTLPTSSYLWCDTTAPNRTDRFYQIGRASCRERV